MNVRFFLTNALTVVIAGCAIIVTGLMVRQTLAARPAAVAAEKGRGDKSVPDWVKYTEAGYRIGPDNAPVKILEFGDFECPVCGSFARSTLQGVRANFPGKVQVVFRNWPLPYHHLAYPAARAVECASRQGRFQPYFDALYDKQDSLGLKSFDAFARESGVPDLAAFSQCNNAPGTVPSIEADINAARAIGGHGTPTIVINGTMIANSLDSTRVDSMVRAALAAAK